MLFMFGVSYVKSTRYLIPVVFAQNLSRKLSIKEHSLTSFAKMHKERLEIGSRVVTASNRPNFMLQLSVFGRNVITSPFKLPAV